ncbi:M20/M25/M40 family metallo-hydrolase [Aliikangiella sp. IMCC44359]|uniref:M20/M25/M40 family metallo-hydrolase n=1 Tax=Aliikangiella sp. IMCC44359 TaxID=3459125 RepID=UPI00403AD9E8
MKKNIIALLAFSVVALMQSAFAESDSLTSATEKKVWVSIGADAYELINQKHSSKLSLARANIHNASHGNVAVVQIPESQINALSEFMHDEFNRCGGFVFHDTFNEAQTFAMMPAQMLPSVAVNYTIDNSAGVNALLNQLSTSNLTSTVNSLKSYHNRYYTQQSGVDAANWIKNKWSSISNGRSDISVETYNHTWNQPSVIATITGTTNASEVVVIGGHLDSINQSNPSSGRAPGADDNASGIAVITETLRAIVASGFKPKRTIKLMGYAAEEVGLRGSKAIAQSMSSSVIGAAQFDMTGRKGPQSADIVFMSDYTNNSQTQFMKQLIDTYLPGISHGTDQCGYACSDHASWHNQGVAASFPAEAKFNDSNQAIHTANDTSYDVNHSIKFAKLAAAYVGELAKGGTGTTPDPDPDPDPNPGGNELQNGVAKTGLSASTGSDLKYTFKVPSGATNIKFEMSGGSGDADLYVKFGSAPTDSSYDCRPYKSGNTESCTGSQTGGTYYIRLKAYSAFSSLSIKASYTGNTTPDPDPDPNPGNDPINETINNVSVSQGQWSRYTQVLPAGYSTMEIKISGGSGDADLYVRKGAQSTQSAYDCRPYKNGNNETCNFNNPDADTWYIDIYGYSSASGITLNLKATPK